MIPAPIAPVAEIGVSRIDVGVRLEFGDVGVDLDRDTARLVAAAILRAAGDAIHRDMDRIRAAARAAKGAAL